jgi:hypothetical protein
MYLYKRTYVKNWDHYPEKEKTVITLSGPKTVGIKTDRITEIKEEVACWRKANMIHGWFVDRLMDGADQNGGEHYVDKGELAELCDLCKLTILDRDTSRLPLRDGFFFGSREIGDWYFDDLQNTIDMISPLLAEDGDFYYHANW